MTGTVVLNVENSTVLFWVVCMYPLSKKEKRNARFAVHTTHIAYLTKKKERFGGQEYVRNG